MKFAPKNLLAAALLATFGLAAVAQAPAPVATAEQNATATTEVRKDRAVRHDPARMMQRLANRQARIKEKLQITPAQEGAWNAWVAALQPPAGFKRPDRAELAKLSTPERIDRMRQLRTERNALMDQRGEATKTFYAALSAEQKQAFDSQRSRGGKDGGRSGSRGGYRGHHGHHGHYGT